MPRVGRAWIFGVASVAVVGPAFALGACGSDGVTPQQPIVDASSADREAAAPVDSGPRDAPPEASPPVFCKGLTTDFCGEFNGVTPAAGWDGVDARGGGTVTLVDAIGTSLPKAMRSALPAIAGGSNAANAQVAKKLAIAGNKKIVLAFSTRIGAAAPGPNGSVPYANVIIDGGAIALLRGETSWFVRVARKNAAGDDGDQPVLSSAPPIGTTTRITMEIVLARPSGTLKVDIDGKSVLTQTLATHGDAQPLTNATLALGLIHGEGPIPAMDATFDDVTFDLQP
jgi:hypothetical protein